ncbi:unnamed protein product [Owenia fusiformis]|uniref:Diacylglycerol lipase-alpha n=1 Tax=Owenia fusiformis TaxID=6347 RepID=A0A8S4Q1I2_OWEFU|nr:unnamed protein product [Owenia fusiformis]
MPGIVVFKRRWSVGSDDLVVPAVFLIVLHLIWILVLGIILGVVDADLTECWISLREHVLGYLVILSGSVLVEGCIAWVSMRGTILYTEPRSSMQYLLYVRLGILVAELIWVIIGVVWISQNYEQCTADAAKKAILGIVICNWVVMFSVLVSTWCMFDSAGRSWVKMKRYQQSLKDRERRKGPGSGRKSGSRRRNWRQRRPSYHTLASVESVVRKAMRAYENSWNRRCNVLFCCVQKDRHKNSFTEIAKLFTEFFRDLDVVPSDVVAGLVLLRRHQKMRRKTVVAQASNDVYQFLSGVSIRPDSRFLCLKDPVELTEFKKVVHFMKYALAAYGWPLYIMTNPGTGLCGLCSQLACCCCIPSCSNRGHQHSIVIGDNCCQCNFAALKQQSGLKTIDIVYATYHVDTIDIVYATYHVDIGETPFFVAVDHEEQKVVICIRGTLSLQDVLTDLKADAEPLPLDPLREDWLGHKGMVQAAVYIKQKLKEEMILSQAFGRDLDRGTQQYDLVLVGHSLGAGTAAILAILLQQEHPNLHCYSYSPPGGLLSANTVEETKSFITSVVVAKDVIPRIGLYQMEALRTDLISVIKKSDDPKWKTIFGTMLCCGPDPEPSILQMCEYQKEKEKRMAEFSLHPSDSQIALTTHTPLFPPGRIIHIVRNHPKKTGCSEPDPVYQALWVENSDLDEVLISPTMINDHMPDNVMDALEKVLITVGPAKPTRKLTEAERKALLTSDTPESTLERESIQPVFLEPDYLSPRGLDHSRGNRSSGAYSEGNNSLSWDYTSPLEADIADMRTRKSTRPHSDIKLELLPPGDDWQNDNAPLATPETLSLLSDTSSLDSHSLRGSFKSGYQKLLNGQNKMDPIQQSPLRQAKPEGYCYYVKPKEESSGAADSDNFYAPRDYSPTRRGFTLEGTPPLAQSTPYKNQVTTRASVEPNTAPGGHNPTGDHIALHRHPLPNGTVSPSPIKSQKNLNGNGEIDSGLENDETPTYSDLSQKIARSNSTDNYKLTFEEDADSSFQNEPTYTRHSPDSGDYQVLYSPVEGHYSHGGRGYPHGGYFPQGVSGNAHIPALKPDMELEYHNGMNDQPQPGTTPSSSPLHPPTVKLSESDSHIIDLDREQTLHRTKEEPNIPHLTDNNMIFADINNKHHDKLTRNASSPDNWQVDSTLNTPEDEYGCKIKVPSQCSDDVYLTDLNALGMEETNV